MNEILESPPWNTKWKPSVIAFYSAKQTRWGPSGLEFIKGISPAVGDAVRQLVLALEDRLDKKWYDAELLALVDRAATLFSEAGVKRDDILLVIDNTETLARSPGEEEELTRVFSRIAGRLCRLLMTSRRRERVEAYPIQVLPMDEETGYSLLRELGHVYRAQPLLAAGDARLRKVSRQLSGRPILLDVFVRHASRAGRSIDDALQLVLRDAREDLGEFLFQDAWQRIGPEQREVFLVLGRLGGTVDGQVVGWICSDIGVPHSIWQDAFEQTRFGSLVDYGARYDVQLEVGMNEFLARKYQSLPSLDQQRIERITQAVSRRYRQLLAASEASVTDRVVQAFRSSAAKAAKLAASAGSVEDAVLWYEEAVRVDAANAALWDRYAWYLMMKARDLSRARECASEACRLDPEDPDAHFTAGMIAARLRDVAEADRLLSRAEQRGKSKHLCLVQHARARIEAAVEENDKKNQSYLMEAEQLLEQALQAPSETKRREELVSECDKLMRRVRVLRRKRGIARKPHVVVVRKGSHVKKESE
ncbi:tetratricopeptide repeat protein [Stigmatella erecta]|uniref:tetratricopeptide repeat protein n=1 Tax=Stigmatella erecta TaxID=83460 RepID=UPI0011603A84|nr:hypothetical protein [Stigmatella erecta]